MNRNELLSQVEKHLIDNQQVADEAALGLKLLRQAYAELKRPVDGGETQPTELLAQLASADRTISAQQEIIDDHEGMLYDLLLQTGLLPDVDGEPALSLRVAIKEDPECLEKLNNAVTDSSVVDTDTARFISAVRNLLGLAYDVSLMDVYKSLEREAQRIASLDQGIAQRDIQLQHMETLINKCLEATGTDWQDVDQFPDIIRELRAGEKPIPLRQIQSGFAKWAQDAIDLAHGVRGDLRPENRVMAKAAEHIILTAPRGDA